MAITTFKIARNYGRADVDCAVPTGLVSAEIRMVNYGWKPPDQPKAIFPTRIVEMIVKLTTGGPPPVSDHDFFGLPQSEWTVLFSRNYTGSSGAVVQKYDMILLECRLLIEDTDDQTYKVTFGMTEEKLKGVVSTKS